MIHNIVVMSIIIVTHILCYILMSDLKYSMKKTALIYSLYIVICVGLVLLTTRMLFSVRSFNAISFAFISTIVMSFFVFMATSVDPVCKKVFLFLSYSTVFCIFYCCSVMISSIWFSDELGVYALYAKTLIRTLLYLPAVWAYIRFLRPALREVQGSNKKVWYSISLVSMLFLVVFSLFLMVYYMENSFKTWYSVLFAATVAIYCSVLWIIFGMIRYMRKESRTELIEKNMEYLQQQLRTASENEFFARTIRHDFRHHNQNIATLLKKGKTDEALRYIEQYNESLNTAKIKEFCPNVTVNAILTNFYHIAKNNGIAFAATADTPKCSVVADTDFVAILSNLLENAVNGCKECGARGEIKTNIRSIGDKIVIVCSNPCSDKIEIVNNMIKIGDCKIT